MYLVSLVVWYLWWGRSTNINRKVTLQNNHVQFVGKTNMNIIWHIGFMQRDCIYVCMYICDTHVHGTHNTTNPRRFTTWMKSVTRKVTYELYHNSNSTLIVTYVPLLDYDLSYFPSVLHHSKLSYTIIHTLDSHTYIHIHIFIKIL